MTHSTPGPAAALLAALLAASALPHAGTAEAATAYLITDLGNMFPIGEDGPAGAQGGVRDIGVFLMGSGARIGAVSPGDALFYVSGTGPLGEVHGFEPYFDVPAGVKSNGTGYVILANGTAGPGISAPLGSFFFGYEYDSGSGSLRTTDSSVEPAGSLEYVGIASPHDSRSASGTISSTADGFRVGGAGTYAVKLLPDTAYWTDHDFACRDGSCDAVSVITTGADIMRTTPDGLALPLSGSVDGGSPPDGAATFSAEIGYDIGVHVSSLQNVQVRHGVHDVGFEAWCEYTFYLGPYLTRYDFEGYKSGAVPVPYSGAYSKSARTDGGRTILEEVSFTSSVTLDPSGAGTYPVDHRGSACGDYDIDGREDPYLTGVSSAGMRAYDTGIPVVEHVAYWTQDETGPPYPAGGATASPHSVQVHGDDAYMIIRKETAAPLEVKAAGIGGGAGLEVGGLPPGIHYSLADGAGFAIRGMTGDDGTLSLGYSDGLLDGAGGLSLNLFPDDIVYREMSGMHVYDARHGRTFHLNGSAFDGVVYATTQYVKLPLALDMTVEDVTLSPDGCPGGIPLQYMARGYAAGEGHMWIPVVPGLEAICLTVDGIQATLRYDDFEGGRTTASAPGQSRHYSSAPDFGFCTTCYSPVSGVEGNAVSNAISVSTGTQFVSSVSGRMSVSVSGSILGSVGTHVFREYSDDSLTGHVSDIEDSSVSVGISVYRNGELERQADLARYHATGHETKLYAESLPEGDGKRAYYSYNCSFLSCTPPDVPDLAPPWHVCDAGYSDVSIIGITAWVKKCAYRHEQSSDSVCVLDMSYDIRGSLSGSTISFDVGRGDVIEYYLTATLDADHSGLACGNRVTATYGSMSMLLDLEDVHLEHGA